MKEDQVAVGLMGAGFIAEWHARALSDLKGVALVAVCDRDVGRANELADAHGIAHRFDSIDAMLNGVTKLDAVHVLLPPPLHALAARQALESGKHVLIEKPMAEELNDCEALIRIAADHNRALAVNHNFLFLEPYEALVEDVRSGRLGLIDQVNITWAKHLRHLTNGPFTHWMFDRPGNLLLEIAPHSLACMLDLVGPPQELNAAASNVCQLPGGGRCYRRWALDATCGPTAVRLQFSFVPGFGEYQVDVRGSLGSATADFEANTYTRQQHTSLAMDFDRYVVIARRARELKKQARRNCLRYIASKVRPSNNGDAFRASMRSSFTAFYRGLNSDLDRRIHSKMGRDVVEVCWRAVRAANVELAPTKRPCTQAATLAEEPSVLVIGGSGFIGRPLVHKLVEAGRTVRVMSRAPISFDEDRRDRVELLGGDIRDANSLDTALAGIHEVFHLARGGGKTWKSVYEQDVLATKLVAEKCLDHGVQRLIYTGSIVSYDRGAGSKPITEATPLEPPEKIRQLYARSKTMSERLLMEMFRTKGLPLVICRPGIVLGRGGSPYHPGVAFWSNGPVVRLWGHGSNRLPIVLVDDVADALVSTMDAEGVEGECFNLVCDARLTAREYIEELESYTGIRLEVVPTELWKYYGIDLLKWPIKVALRYHDRRMPRYREWRSRANTRPFDCSKARKKLGWCPVDDRDLVIRYGIQLPSDEFVSGGASIPSAKRQKALL